MLYHDRIDVSEGIGIYKTSALKECDIAIISNSNIAILKIEKMLIIIVLLMALAKVKL